MFTVTYGYDGSGRVNSITQSDGAAIAIAYDGSGRVTSFAQTVSGSVTRTTSIAYSSGSTAITDAAGQVTTLEYNSDGSLKKITAPPATSGATAQTVQYAYDSNGNLTSVTDALGGVTTYGSYTNGRWGTSTDANGNVTTRTHDAHGNVLTETQSGLDQSGSTLSYTERFVYDSSDRLIWHVSRAGRVTQMTYDSAGQLTGKTGFTLDFYNVAALSATTAITASQLDTWKAGHSDKTRRTIETYAYDARGGLSTTTTYAATDSSGAAVAASGYAFTTTVFDQAGRMLSRRNAYDNSELFVYDGLGRLTASTDVHGGTTSFAFTDSASDGGTATVVTLANGYVQTSTFNKAGELISRTDSGDYVTGGTASYEYDALGRVRVATDANSNKSYILYDKAGRKTADIDAYGHVTEYRYDAGNRVVATVRWTNAISSGNLATLANPANTLEIAGIRPGADAADIWAWSVYDAGGRLIESIAGDGSAMSYEYDGSDRLVRTNTYANKLNSAQLTTIRATPPSTALLPTADATYDSYSRNFYDGDEHVGTMDDAGNLIGKSFDAAGWPFTETRYPVAVNPATSATASLNSLLATVTDAVRNLRTTQVYDGEGRLRFTIQGRGNSGAPAFVTEYVYNDGANQWSDSAGPRKTIQYAISLSALSVYTVAGVKAALTAAGALTDTANRISYGTYDDAGRLSYTIDATGAVTGLVYDTQGKLIRTTQFATARTTSSIPSHADLLSWQSSNAGSDDRIIRSYYNDRLELAFTIDAEGFVTRNYYDAKGQLTETRRWDTAVSATNSWTIATVAGAVSGVYASNTYSYDALGRVATVRDGEGHGHDYSYYGNGTLAWDIRMAGGAEESRTNFVYDATGRLVDRIDGWESGGANPSTHYVYDGRGDLVTETDPGGHTITRTYDKIGQVLTETNAAGGVVSYQYDPFGNVVKVTDERSNSTYNYYDRFGRLVSSRDAENYITDTGYTAFGQVASVTRHSAKVTNSVVVGGAVPSWSWATTDVPATTYFEYDKLGHLTKSTDALGNYEQYTFNAFGQQATVTSKLGAVTTNTYNKRGLLASISTAISGVYGSSIGTVTTTIVDKFEYDARGNRITTIEAFGTAVERTTRYYYDKADRLIEKGGTAVTVGYSGTTATPSEYYHYDGRGNLIETIDPAGARTLFYYDDLDRKIVEIDALGYYSTFDYDAVGNLKITRSFEGAVTLPSTAGGTPPTAPSWTGYREIFYTYDNINRLISSYVGGPQLYGAWNGSSYATSTSAATSYYEYDAAGNVVKTTAPDGGVTFSYYDKLGRKTAQIDAELYRTDWEYDAEGNVTSERRYATPATGAPTTSAPLSVSTASADRVTTFTYDKLGHRLTESRSAVTAWSVNSATGVLVSATGASTITYAYNALGQVARKTEAAGDYTGTTQTNDYTDYTYDNAGRLIVETHVGLNYGATVSNPTVRYFYNALDDVTGTRQGAFATASGDRLTANTYSLGGRLSTSTDAATNVRTYFYDIAGRVIGEKYSRNTGGTAGTVTEGIATTYDLLGRATRQSVNTISGTSWSEISFVRTAYNAHGDIINRATNTDSAWQESLFYDYAGHLVKTNAGDGVWRHYLYDAAGHQTMAIESEGGDLGGLDTYGALASAYSDGFNATITAYDKRGQATRTIQTQRELSIGGTRQDFIVEQGYNAFGEAAWDKDARGYQTDYTYNTMGRLLKTERPYVLATGEDGVTTTGPGIRPTERFYYDRAGRLIGSEDANSVLASAGRITTRLLAAGTGYAGSEPQVLKEWHLDSGVVERVFDVFGDMTSETDEISRTTAYTYDAMSRMITLTRPGTGGLVEHFSYDSLGQRIGHWNSDAGSSDVETTEYDTMGRIVRSRAFGGDVTTIGYVKGASIQASNGTSGVLPAGGWTVTTTYANGKTAIEATDLYGHVISKQDLGGHTSSFTYDLAGRMTSRTTGSLTYNYAYVNTGLIGQITTGTDLSAYGVAFTVDTTAYTYDKNGNRLTETFARKEGVVYINGHYEYEDFYPYDQYWVEDPSTYWVGTTTLSASTAAYDALNRLTTWTSNADNLPPAGITYYYDANSNIRRSTAIFSNMTAEGFWLSTASITQDYWYKFDVMNRVVTAKGALSGGAIVRGDGVDYAYDAAGQRVSMSSKFIGNGNVTYWDPYWHEEEGGGYVSATVPYTGERKETYTYTATGQLDKVRIAQSGYYDNGDGTVTVTAMPSSGALKADYDYDAQGRQIRQLDYLYDGDTYSTAAYDRQVTYNAKGQIESEIVSQRQGSDILYTTATNYYETGTPADYALGSLLTSSSSTTKNGSWYSSSTTTNTYGWRDGAVIDSTNIASYISGGPSTSYTTSYVYDDFGLLVYANVVDGTPHNIRWLNDMTGQAIRRDESPNPDGRAPHEAWFRFNGKQMGYTGNNGTQAVDYQTSIDTRTTAPGGGRFLNGAVAGETYADFDQSLAPINGNSHGSAGGSFTAQGGESLGQLAQQLWGDSSLWYRLAQANGLTGETRLGAGQTIAIPSGIMRSSHSAATFNPYDPLAAMGDTSPTTPAPPVMSSGGGRRSGCGVIGQLLVMAISIAVSVALPGSGVFVNAMNGMIGSLAGQMFGVLTGIQQDINFNSIAMAGIAGGIGGALKGVDAFGMASKLARVGSDVVRGMAANALTQGVGLVTRMQKNFDFAGLAVAGVIAGVGRAVSDNIGGKARYNEVGKIVEAGDAPSFLNQTIASTASSVAGAAARSLTTGTSFGDNLLAVLPDVIGSTLGRAAGNIGKSRAPIDLLAQVKDGSYSPKAMQLSDRYGVPFQVDKDGNYYTNSTIEDVKSGVSANNPDIKIGRDKRIEFAGSYQFNQETIDPDGKVINYFLDDPMFGPNWGDKPTGKSFDSIWVGNEDRGADRFISEVGGKGRTYFYGGGVARYSDIGLTAIFSSTIDGKTDPNYATWMLTRGQMQLHAIDANIARQLEQVDFEANIGLNIMFSPTLVMGGGGGGYVVREAGYQTTGALARRAIATRTGQVLRAAEKKLLDISKGLCFASGTPVHTLEGLKAIDLLRAGDVVWSRSEYDVGDSSWRKVTEAGCTGEHEIYEVMVSAESGQSETYRTTELHPFWVERGAAEEGCFIAASSLPVGAQLRLADGSAAYVMSVSATGVTEAVYNFSVEGWHTYHVGELGVWVHNECLDGLFARVSSSGMPRAEFDRLAAGWSKGTYDSVADSIIDHAGRHGYADDVAKYMRVGGDIQAQVGARARGWTAGPTRIFNQGSAGEYSARTWSGPNNRFAIIDNNGLLRSWGIN